MKHIDDIIRTLQSKTTEFQQPLVDQIIAEYGHDPFLILISCLLSLRAKDITTIHVCRVLFARAQTPERLLAIDRQELEKIVYRTGFYRNKAKIIQEVSQVLLERFNGKVPNNYQELIRIKGVGNKTANLVLGLAFGKPAICVDTHVHRISNRLGIIKTKKVEQTEKELQKTLSKKYWTIWNHLLVIWGQNICVPISPKCSKCAISNWCKKVGVTKSR